MPHRLCAAWKTDGASVTEANRLPVRTAIKNLDGRIPCGVPRGKEWILEGENPIGVKARGPFHARVSTAPLDEGASADRGAREDSWGTDGFLVCWLVY